MTVSSTTVKSGPYNGNGSATNFAVNTVYTAKAEVTVIVTSASGVETTKTLDTHYTLTNPGDSGTVTFLVAPASGETVTILTTLAQTQATDLTPGGSFSANVVEGALDKLTRLVQQIAEKVTRAPKLRQTSTTGEVSLPEPSALAFLRWNAAGTSFENGTTGGPGSGDVVGPASSTDNAIARFDGASGQALQNSGVTVDDSNNVSGIVNLAITGNISGAVNLTQTGYHDITEIAAPSNPAANVMRTYAVDSGGTTKLEAKDSAGTTHDLTHFTQTGAGAVLRTQQAKLRDVIHVKDFGAVGDGATDDTTALQAAKTAADTARNAIVSLSGGRFVGGQSFTSGSPIWTNNVEPTLMRFDKPSILGLFEGIDGTPDTINDDPILWVQKHTRFDSSSDNNAHTVGGIFSEVVVDGSGSTGSTETDGAWISVLGNAVARGANQGTEGAPDYDLEGAVIGVAGFARSEKPNGIVAGLWGYATTPELTDTEFDAWGSNFSTVGVEVNIESRHKDPGAQTDFGIKGGTTGVLLANFPSAIGVRDWTFGIAFYPQMQGGGSATDPDDWHGFHDGVFVDFYKRAGVRFGRSKSGAYGLLFPASYADAALRPSAAMHLGDNQINLGSYTGSTFNDGDFWNNANTLFFRNNGVSARILQERSGVVTLTTTTDFATSNGTQFSIGNVASAANKFTAFAAAAAGAPALAVTGSDTDITMEIRAKGTGGMFFQTGGGTQFRVISVASAVNHIQAAGAATTAAPRLEALGSDTNIDLRLTPKGTGQVISAASLRAHSGTAVPAGGTAGAGLLMSSTTNLGIFFGSGVPTLSAAQGSLYVRTDGSSTSTRLYVNTNGTTGWTNVTTAA